MNAAASCCSCIHLMFLVYFNIYIADAMSISLLCKFEYLQAASTVCYVHVAILYSDVVGGF